VFEWESTLTPKINTTEKLPRVRLYLVYKSIYFKLHNSLQINRPFRSLELIPTDMIWVLLMTILFLLVRAVTSTSFLFADKQVKYYSKSKKLKYFNWNKLKGLGLVSTPYSLEITTKMSSN
jgi:hypothetical protein